MRNYGLDLAREERERSPEDYIFGAVERPCLAPVPMKDRLRYLPKGEVQRGLEDFMDCGSRGPVNILETKFNFMLDKGILTKEEISWLSEQGYLSKGRVTFSDRFIAIKSGTTRDGNSLKAPLDAIHRHGLIPKSMLAAGKRMTWADYHDQGSITAEMETMGREFLARFSIKYEIVYLPDFDKLVERELLDVAGYAWSEPNADGVYPRSPYPVNHVFVYFEKPSYTIFDNYEDDHDGDFVKRLASDYGLLNYGYRLVVNRDPVAELVPLYRRLLELLRAYYQQLIFAAWKS